MCVCVCVCVCLCLCVWRLWSLLGDGIQLFRSVRAHKTAILAMVRLVWVLGGGGGGWDVHVCARVRV